MGHQKQNLSVFFKVCVFLDFFFNTAWIDVWECMLAHSCECSSEQMQSEHVKGLNMGELSGVRITAQYSYGETCETAQL